jgi:hypothetical protein
MFNGRLYNANTPKGQSDHTLRDYLPDAMQLHPIALLSTVFISSDEIICDS